VNAKGRPKAAFLGRIEESEFSRRGPSWFAKIESPRNPDLAKPSSIIAQVDASGTLVKISVEQNAAGWNGVNRLLSYGKWATGRERSGLGVGQTEGIAVRHS
jgi:hypothetical protein